MSKKNNHLLPVALHPLWFLLLLILAIGLACSLPSQSQPENGARTPEIVDNEGSPPSPTLPPPPTPTPQPLPPALVEVNPMPGTDIALQGEFTFFFNQPMDRGSVESALVGDPQLSGQLSWLDDATLVFQPDAAYPPDTPLTVELGTTARAANGLAFLEPVRLAYRTAAPMHAVQMLPAPGSVDADPASAIIATFNQPVVPLGADPGTLPAAFSVTPAVSGHGEWINTSTYAFYPDPPMYGGTTYTASLNHELRSTAEGSFDGLIDSPGNYSWSFSTATPRLLSISPQADSSSVPLDTSIELIFNQSMDTASVEQNLSLLSLDGAEISGVFGWNDDFSTLVFTPTQWLKRDSAYTVFLYGTAQSLGGSVVGTDTSQRFYTVSEFFITGTDPVQDGFIGNYQGISFNFSSPPEVENPLDYIQITPEVANLNFWYGGESLNFSGSFEPNTQYVATLSGDLTDRWGSTLGQDFILRFRTEPLRPTLFIAHGESELFVTPQDTMLSAQAANIRSAELMIGSVPMDQIWQFLGPSSYEIVRSYLPTDAQQWVQPFDVSNSRLSTIQLPLTPGTNALPPGVYHYSIYADELDYPPGPFLIVSSNVHLTFKLSPTQTFVWALDLRNNTPVVDAPVTVYDIDGNALASGTTDRDGVFQAAIPAKPDIYTTFYAILGSPGDETFSLAYSTWDAGLQGYDFSIATDYTGPRIRVYLYTDRPIYRPGDTVNFRAIVRQARNGRYSLPDLGILPVNITDGNYQPILDLEIPISEYGSAHGNFVLAEDAPPGYYQVNTPYGLVSFQVAEYRKPEIDLQITAQPGSMVAGEMIIAQVEARYFFDAPAGDVPLTWSVTAAREYFSLPGYAVGGDDYGWILPFGMYGFNPYGDLIASGEGRTGSDGLLSIEIPTTLAESAKRYTIEVTLLDESGFPVSNRTEVVVHPADFYVGVRPDSWVGTSGEEMNFEIKTVDWEKNPTGNLELIARFQKITWVRSEKLDVWGYPAYLPEYTPVSSANFRTGADGLARLAFTPPEPGTYELEISGDGALTQLTIWVGGAGQVTWSNLPNQHIELTPDQERYLPGEHAQVFIPNPLGDNVQALITIERGEVMHHEVLNIAESGYTLDLPLTSEDAPNVYLAVTLVGRNSQAQFDFRQGFTNIEVEPLEQTLNVDLTPIPERAGPRDEVAFTVRVTDADGNPVQGEFSLAVIDQAVLALADPFEPDIVQAFYGIQPLGVRTGLSLAAYAHRFTDTAGGLGGGGGGEVLVPTVRENFPDTAYWNAEIVTDANGEAQITLQLPDNLTTWQATTRGLTMDTRVGEATTELVATKDLLIRPVTPRFLVVGDHLALTGIVHNNTASDLTVEVVLQASGFSLDDPATASQTIAVPAAGRVAVDWWGTVEAVDTADLIFSVRSGELNDATKPTWGDLPVLRYTAPQTFGTAGTMETGGERLEIVSLPRTFDPNGGDLKIELAPSLAAAMLPGLDVLEHYPYECTEQTLSRFLPNLEAFRAVQALGLSAPDLETRLERTLNQGLQRLVARQNDDGGWGWWSSPSLAGNISDPYITSYVLFGLSRARQAGAFVDEIVMQDAVNYLIATLPAPEMLSEPWQLDRLAFQYFALAEASTGDPAGVGMLYERRSQLSSWAQAFLALTLESLSPDDPRLRELYSDLEASAIRSASGTHWESHGSRANMETAVFSTSVVVYALAQHDPASGAIPEAVRYLMAARGADGAWASTYETAWSVMALTKVMQGTGELAGDFGFRAALNGVGLVEGVAGGDARLNPVDAAVPVSSLYAEDPNALTIQRDDGPGRLYYTAHLEVLRPVEDVTPLDRGISVERSYETMNGSITTDSEPQPSVAELVTVKVALTLKNAAYYLVVEDYIPAGAEILDTSLKTSQQVSVEYDPRDPFNRGWGWWYFNDPQIYDDHIAWSVEFLPAGTYELTYTLVLNQPGDFRVLPARAWEFYFPEVQGNSAGDVLVIED